MSKTKVPEQMEKFWSSGGNKEKLQILAKEKILELAKIVGVNCECCNEWDNKR